MFLLLAATFKFKYCWCHVAIILLLPCWCHSATSMMLMPYCCWYSAVAILLLSFCFCHAAAALFVILLFPYCCYWCHVVMCHVSLLHSKSERLTILISGYTIIEDGNTLRVGVSDPEVCSTNKQHGFHRYIWENTDFFSRLRHFCKAQGMQAAAGSATFDITSPLDLQIGISEVAREVCVDVWEWVSVWVVVVVMAMTRWWCDDGDGATCLVCLKLVSRWVIDWVSEGN